MWLVVWLLAAADLGIALPRPGVRIDLSQDPLLKALRRPPLPIAPAPKVELEAPVRVSGPALRDGAGGAFADSSGALSAVGPEEVSVEDRGQERPLPLAPNYVVCRLPAPSVDEGVIRRQLYALRRCYESSLKRHPALGGRLASEVRVRADGTIEAADVDTVGNTLDDDELAACLTAAVSRWRLAPADAPRTFRLPLMFSR